MKIKIMGLMLMFILTTGLVLANPNINVEKAQQQPIPAQPGDTVEVWVSIQNTGDETRDFTIRAKDSFPFTLINERDRERTINVIGRHQDYVLRYVLKIDSDAPEGINNFVVEYETGTQRGVVTKNIAVEVRTTEAIATIGNVVLEPEEITPGEEGKLTLSIRNIGGSNLRDFTIGLDLDKQLGPQDMIINDPPFFPVGSGTEKSINRIRPGQTTEFVFDLQAYPNADTTVYKIPVYMSYFDDNGNRHEKNDLIALKVNTGYELDVRVDSSELTKNSPSGDVTFIVVNYGLSDLKLMNLEITENDDFVVRSASNKVFLGSLESDDFDTTRFRVRALAEDEVNFPVTLTFRDSMNNEFTEEFIVTHRLAEGKTNGNTFIIILVLLVAGIGYWYYRRKKKQRLLDEE